MLKVALLLGIWVLVSALVSWAVGTFIRTGSGEDTPTGTDTHRLP